MLDILQRITELIAPLDPSIILLRDEDPDKFIRHFHPIRYTDTIALADYSHPTVRAAITANKFHDYSQAATLLAALIDHWFTTIPSKPTLLVPIPLGSKRQKERGYNQVERVLSRSNTPHIKIEKPLIRFVETQPQTELDREKRFMNVQNIFSLDKTVRLNTVTRIIIIDDVVTTGATLRSAKETLRPYVPKSCELITLAIAH